nr:hypothetical protein [uncultured Serratia sp.]
MNQQLLNEFFGVLKEKYDAVDLEDNTNEKDGVIITHGSFKINERKYSFNCYFSKESSFMGVEYSLKINTNNKPLIKLYKAANSVNNQCPGMKCVIDSNTAKVVYLTFSTEIVSSKLDNYRQLVEMLDVLPTGGMFFLNGLKKGA